MSTVSSEHPTWVPEHANTQWRPQLPSDLASLNAPHVQADGRRINPKITQFMRLRKQDSLAWSVLVSMAPKLGIRESDIADAAAHFCPTVADPLDFVGEWQNSNETGYFSVFQVSKNVLVYKETFSNDDILIGLLRASNPDTATKSLTAHVYIGQPDDADGDLFGAIELISESPACLAFRTRDYENEWKPYGKMAMAKRCSRESSHGIPLFFRSMIAQSNVESSETESSSCGSDWEAYSPRSPLDMDVVPSASTCNIPEAPKPSDVPLPSANLLSRDLTLRAFNRGGRRKRQDEESARGPSSTHSSDWNGSTQLHSTGSEKPSEYGWEQSSWNNWGWRDWGGWEDRWQPEPTESKPAAPSDYVQLLGDGRKLGMSGLDAPGGISDTGGGSVVRGTSDASHSGTSGPGGLGGISDPVRWGTSGPGGRGGTSDPSVRGGTSDPVRGGTSGPGVRGQTAPSATLPRREAVSTRPTGVQPSRPSTFPKYLGDPGSGAPLPAPIKLSAPPKTAKKKKKRKKRVDAELARQYELEAEARECRRRKGPPERQKLASPERQKLASPERHKLVTPEREPHLHGMRKIPSWVTQAASFHPSPVSSATSDAGNPYLVRPPEAKPRLLTKAYEKATSKW